MRHPFQAWLDVQDIDEASRDLFGEAIVCYSADACRAALVFSYLGLLRSVAYRLMTGTRPVDFPQGFWDKIQSRVREDLTWEDTTFDSIILTKPKPLFLIDDDLREQLRYWRSRRNDAAHARTNEIAAAHVETIWLFVRSNLAKLIVAGGRTGLFERFRRHFDPSFTPPSSEFLHLVREIPVAVRSQEYRDFIRDVLKLTGDIDDGSGYVDDLPDLTTDGNLLLRYIDSIKDERLGQAVVDELRSDQRLLIGALLGSPNLSLSFSRDGAFVRKLWRDLLPFETVFNPRYFAPISESLGVVAFMLRNYLIPESQRDEAVNHILGKLYEGYPHPDYSDEVLDSLAPFGFWEAVHRHAFGHYGKVDWLSRNIALGVEYLSRFPVDSEVARGFAALAPEEPEEGDVYLQNSKFYEPEDAYDLRFYFAAHPDKLEELIRVARENDIDISHFFGIVDPNQPEESD